MKPARKQVKEPTLVDEVRKFIDSMLGSNTY